MSKQRKFANVAAGVPGPKGAALIEKRKQFVPKGIGNNTRFL